VSLVRGFKTQAEKLADKAWTDLGIGVDNRFDVEKFVASMGGRIVLADTLVPRSRLEEIDRLQPFAFSACTFILDDGPAIVLNPVVSEGRQRSDAAHEVAHIVLRHQIRVPERLGDYLFFTGNTDQEDEANWLGGCLLLPRQVVLRAAGRGMNADGIATHYGTTPKMATFRLNATGAARQLERFRARQGV
jgi:Zn-dependent peptidase ImmA (M78 family)